MTTEITAAQAISVLDRQVHQRMYLRDPAGWVEDCIRFPDGEAPTDYQLESLDEMIRFERVCFRGPHGVGKTTPSAWAICWACDVWEDSDFKVATTATAWRQLKQFLWPEVHKWARCIRWDVLARDPWREGAELLEMEIKVAGGQAFAVASNKPARMEGAHADRMLYLFDEAKGIPADTWDAAEGAFSGAGPDTGRVAYALAYSTPGAPAGRFYEIQRRDRRFAHWHAKVVTARQAIDAGRMSEAWQVKMRTQWGEDSAMYQQRVLGNFHTDESAVIPLEWIEKACDRWEALEDGGMLPRVGVATAIGVDVGDEGPDTTVLAPRYGSVIMPLEEHTRGDPMKTTGHVTIMQAKQGGTAIVDVIGVGSGVVARLREVGSAVVAFNAATGTGGRRDRSGSLKFANLRAAAWWGLRERLDPDNGDGIALPRDDDLIGDLSTPRWTTTSNGRILVEPKDGTIEWGIRQRLGRSTNKGDAVVQAFALEILGGMFEPEVETGADERL